MFQFNGTKWHKCDFHLHTTASDCFEDKSVTAEAWVRRAIEQGLSCVAITDHNTAAGIDGIVNAARDTNLTVFPGVEITCDTSKVHFLILFDVTKTATDVEDFLIRCGIERRDFGKQQAYTTQSILQVASLANDTGCIVIPAHIDQYNGLGNIGYAQLNEFYNLNYIYAAQIIHQEFLDLDLRVNENERLKTLFEGYYSPGIDYTTIENWQSTVKSAKEKKIALLTFSDNPHSDDSSQHGLLGIGRRYTWIKMEDEPTLESLRQALLLPSLRIKNYFESEHLPYELPPLWIKSISVKNTAVTGNSEPFLVNFSPQLTTIIGGRGSGKSSILRFLRGVFSRNIENSLEGIVEDQNSFYKKVEARSGKGVFTDNSEVTVTFIRNGIEYQIIATNINGQDNQEIEIRKYNDSTANWDRVEEEGFIDFFEFEHYSQKQIYEIAQKPNSLREHIDAAVNGMESLKHDKSVLKREYLSKSMQIRTIQEQISGKGKLQTELNDISSQIELYQTSSIASLLKEQSKFESNKQKLNAFLENAVKQEEKIKTLHDNIEVPILSVDGFEQENAAQLLELYKPLAETFSNVKNTLVALALELQQSREAYAHEAQNSSWGIALVAHNEAFAQEKERLESEGLSDIENYEKLIETKAEKEKIFNDMLDKEARLAPLIAEKDRLHANYVDKLEEISIARRTFVDDILHDQKVKINIKTFRNQDDFESSLRQIIQRETRFIEDIQALQNICFTGGRLQDRMPIFRDTIQQLRANHTVEGITGHFKNVITGLNDEQMDSLMLLMPEDEIEVKYKPTGSTTFRSLSTASAGQKTTAILTFILSYGNTPLILDQPEDDLDNRLVYELIVDRLKQAKENRQIIVVTHNANIPVNGDAEYILSMDSESRYLKLLTEGSVDKLDIKKEICDVMEGSEDAFNMRSKRYMQINS